MVLVFCCCYCYVASSSGKLEKIRERVQQDMEERGWLKSGRKRRRKETRIVASLSDMAVLDGGKLWEAECLINVVKRENLKVRL